MNILVCTKQVPDTTGIKIDPVTSTLIRDGASSIVSPFDGYVPEVAVRIKDANLDTKIVTVSMGLNQTTNALKECLAIVMDKVCLVSDQTFGGLDTLATSYVLSYTIRKIEGTGGKFDAIFCGKQVTNEDTAQAGPEIAEHPSLPQVTYALEVEAEGDTFRVSKEEPDYNMMIGITMPCPTTSTKPGFDPCYPSIKRKMTADHAIIPVLTVADLSDIDLTQTGLKGSPIKVKESFCLERGKGGVIIKEGSDQVSAAKLVQVPNAVCLI